MPLVAKIRSENPEKLRMDITTLSGFYAGSVLVIKDQFKALLPRQRKFYQGKSQISVMKKVLSVPINPQWLNQILFETPSENWDCKRGRHSLLKSCIDSASGMSVEWKERARDQRNISLKLNDHRVELFLSEFSLQIEKPEEAFRLKAPSSFKKVFLR